MSKGFFVLALLVAAAAATGAVVHLRNGGRLTGHVVARNDGQVHVRTKSGILVSIDERDVARVEGDVTPPDMPERNVRVVSVRPPDESVRPPKVALPATSQPAGWPAAPPGRHAKTCPLRCAECERLFAASLSRVCSHVGTRHALEPLPVRVGNWPGAQVPAASILGLVLLGEGNTLDRGPHAAKLRTLARYVQGMAGRDHPALRMHRTWIVAFGTLFLSKLHHVHPADGRKGQIQRMVRLLESGRQGYRGWCHGLGRRPGGYGPFVATTIWCAAALSEAKNEGVAVDADGLRQTFAGLRQSVGKRSGGAFYFVGGRSHISTGRTGGVAWVLNEYSPGTGAEVRRAKGFLLRHIDAAPHGHGSPLMAFGWAALGAESLGDDLRGPFWKVHVPTILRGRIAATGLFGPQPWKDLGFTDFNDTQPFEAKGTTWPDRMYGGGWATPWMLFAWQLARGRSVLVPHKAPAESQDPQSGA